MRFDREIARALEVGRDLERQSDDAFAVGDVINGAKHYRHAILAYSRAEALARRAASQDHVRFGCLWRGL